MATDTSTGREIRLVENPDGQWTARDVDVGVNAQGATRDEALSTLDEIVAAVSGDSGHEPTDEDIRDLGLDPAVAREQGDLPAVLKE